jgi:multimeric flavodoxin WrbA
MNIPIILGTAREGRQSEKAANFMLQKAIEAGFESEIMDSRDYRIMATDGSGKSPQPKSWQKK